jgi:hypothetical protein
MTHFAKLDENNIVTFVTRGRQEDDGKELELCNRTGDVYKQTSYNTRGGIHYNPETGEPSEDQSKSLRKNYAGIGYYYDEYLDAFISPKPYDSWMLNEDTCLWESPITYPQDGLVYFWNEENQSWDNLEK